MISSTGYEILRLLEGFAEFLGRRALSNQMGVSRSKTRSALNQLLKQGLIRNTRLGYQITEEGTEELDRAADHPLLTQDAKKWVSQVRCGIDSQGHETKVERAAIPNRFSPQTSYVMPMEEMIDEMRKGLAEYDD